jgi:hypothetical protein
VKDTLAGYDADTFRDTRVRALQVALRRWIFSEMGDEERLLHRRQQVEDVGIAPHRESSCALHPHVILATAMVQVWPMPKQPT